MHPQRDLIQSAKQVFLNEQFGTPGGFGHKDTPLVPKDKGPTRTFSGRGGDGRHYGKRNLGPSPFTDPDKITGQRIKNGPADFINQLVKDLKNADFEIAKRGPLRKTLEDLGLKRTEQYKSKPPTPLQASTTEFLTVFKDQLRGKSPDEIEAGGGIHTHGVPSEPYDISFYFHGGEKRERPKGWLKPFGSE